MAAGIRYLVLIEPALCLLTGGTRRIFEKKNIHSEKHLHVLSIMDFSREYNEKEKMLIGRKEIWIF